MKFLTSMPRLKGFRFPREIVAYAVPAYHRVALSTADAEDLLVERGVIVSREAGQIDFLSSLSPQQALRKYAGSLPDKIPPAQGQSYSADEPLDDMLRDVSANAHTAPASQNTRRGYDNHGAKFDRNKQNEYDDRQRHCQVTFTEPNAT